ncbi:hypothetical protein pdam_00001097 [Pocillopora damicornis]|uniref:Uncharacterized protein n=1 Tax=Pocillopora damicornis TaxID=46731 RepID=A0A3M6V2B2_POCDA|nr:hypothetical protein pdam_00001097 [Pocillopora damicornis]
MLLPDKPPRDGRVMANLLDIYDLKNLIHEATRITKTSETLLDLFLTDNLRKTQSSGVVHVNISDHSLVFAMLRASEQRIRSRKIQFRSLKNFDKQHFLHDLHNVPFQVAEIFDDVDDKLYVRIRGNQVPFINEQWRKAIRQKNRLWKRFIRERTDTNYELYKRQRNICTSLRRKAIKTFFDKKSESENPREFWDTYRPFLHSRKSTQANDIILKEHDVVITDKNKWRSFNSYFVNVADGVPEITEQSYGKELDAHPSIQAIFNNNEQLAVRNKFAFQYTYKTQVEALLLKINSRKSCGHDGIPPQLVKESANAIADNGMKANPAKHQGIVLGKTDYPFSFSTTRCLERFGIILDNELNFKEHISSVRKKINNQFSVFKRFGKLISTEIMLRLYKTFMLPHFHYCSMIWHFCNSEDSVKLDTLNRRILRFVLKDWDSNYDDLLDKAGVCGLAKRRIQNMMICIFNCLHLGKYPCYLKQLIKLRSTAYSLRGTNIL